MPSTPPPPLSGMDPRQLMAAAMRPSPVSSPAWGWEPPPAEQIARLFPEYEVTALIGRGSMGAVYRAVQKKLDRAVAIKLLPAEIAAQGDLATRFEREARTLAKLSHPNIVSLHDFGSTAEGHLYIVMEYVEGTDLGQIIHAAGGEKLNVPRALEIVRQICDALQYAHGRGLVHRDIKPGNVLVDRAGNVKVADFGLAKLLGTPATLTGQTVAGTMIGTPEYIAPEQLRGGDVDHRADIYSLGVMFYEMLTGDLPRGAWQPPSQRVPAADARMDEVVTRAMQQEPERRYQQASEVKGALNAPRIPTPPVPVIEPKPEGLDHLAGMAAFAGGIVIAALLLMGIFGMDWPISFKAEGSESAITQRNSQIGLAAGLLIIALTFSGSRLGRFSHSFRSAALIAGGLAVLIGVGSAFDSWSSVLRQDGQDQASYRAYKIADMRTSLWMAGAGALTVLSTLMFHSLRRRSLRRVANHATRAKPETQSPPGSPAAGWALLLGLLAVGGGVLTLLLGTDWPWEVDHLLALGQSSGIEAAGFLLLGLYLCGAAGSLSGRVALPFARASRWLSLIAACGGVILLLAAWYHSTLPRQPGAVIYGGVHTDGRVYTRLYNNGGLFLIACAAVLAASASWFCAHRSRPLAWVSGFLPLAVLGALTAANWWKVPSGRLAGQPDTASDPQGLVVPVVERPSPLPPQPPALPPSPSPPPPVVTSANFPAGKIRGAQQAEPMNTSGTPRVLHPEPDAAVLIALGKEAGIDFHTRENRWYAVLAEWTASVAALSTEEEFQWAAQTFAASEGADGLIIGAQDVGAGWAWFGNREQVGPGATQLAERWNGIPWAEGEPVALPAGLDWKDSAGYAVLREGRAYARYGNRWLFPADLMKLTEWPDLNTAWEALPRTLWQARKHAIYKLVWELNLDAALRLLDQTLLLPGVQATVTRTTGSGDPGELAPLRELMLFLEMAAARPSSLRLLPGVTEWNGHTYARLPWSAYASPAQLRSMAGKLGATLWCPETKEEALTIGRAFGSGNQSPPFLTGAVAEGDPLQWRWASGVPFPPGYERLDFEDREKSTPPQPGLSPAGESRAWPADYRIKAGDLILFSRGGSGIYSGSYFSPVGPELFRFGTIILEWAAPMAELKPAAGH